MGVKPGYKQTEVGVIHESRLRSLAQVRDEQFLADASGYH